MANARCASIELGDGGSRAGCVTIALHVRLKPDAQARENAGLNGQRTLRINRTWRWWIPRRLRNNRTPSLARQASIEWPRKPQCSLLVRLKPDAPARENAGWSGQRTLRINRTWRRWIPRRLRNDRTPMLARQASIEWPQTPRRPLHVRWRLSCDTTPKKTGRKPSPACFVFSHQ